MRHSWKGNLRPTVRLSAAVSLVIWVAAFGFCSDTCCIGESHGKESPAEHTEASHHDSEGSHGSSRDPSHHQDHKSHQDSFCDSLKTVVIGDAQFFSKPNFQFTQIIFVPAVQLTAVPRIEPSIFRQRWRQKWVFTPEVYLGPAFRSLAPPFGLQLSSIITRL